MGRLFNPDSAFWNALTKLTDVMILSLLFIVTSIPIITVGASLTALYYNMFRLTKDTEGRIVQGYFRCFRENLKKATLLWLGCLFIAAVLAGDIWICYSLKTPAASFILAVTVVLAVVYLMILTYLFPLFSRCIADTKQIIFMAFVMSVKECVRTVFLIFITGIMVAAGVFVLAPFLILAPGVIAFSHAFIFNDIFKKYQMEVADAA